LLLCEHYPAHAGILVKRLACCGRQNARQLAGRGLQNARDLGSRSQKKADELAAQFVERRKRGQSHGALGVEDLVAQSRADDLELVVLLANSAATFAADTGSLA
jgi:hypothetical protein